MFKKIISFLGTKIKNPLVGFGVVGIKTLVKLSVIFGDIGFVAVSYTHLTLPTNREV